jgi:hypothetical protein
MSLFSARKSGKNNYFKDRLMDNLQATEKQG